MGFASPGWATDLYTSPKNSLFNNLDSLSLLNLLLFLCLIAALSPHRQVLQDWARYRKQRVFTRKSFWNRALVQDLIWSEKSPAIPCDRMESCACYSANGSLDFTFASPRS